ncbi:MAG: hypothetical protein RJA25_1874 [Bacteroidota bacterium]|jgi:drug/metabolite transporter (DMT)-like permease
MLFLILSIVFSTSLVVILRLFKQWNIKTEHGIAFNYFICCITGILAMPNKYLLKQTFTWDGWWICLLLGLCFILIFLLIGKSTHLLGVATTGIAFKLSFVIPTIVAILLYGDALTWNKIIGIILAVLAVFFLAYQPDDNEIAGDKNEIETNSFIYKKAWMLPLIIFLGSGLTDALFNFIQRNYTPAGFDHVVTIMVFAGAFITGFILFGFQKEMYQWKNLLGGIVLGVPNYGSLYFLLQALKHSNFAPSILFPINNLGIVALSAIVGLVIFKEHFTKRKIIGFVLAIISIATIGFLN